MDFVAYLISKNIDSQKFQSAEKGVYELWQNEFMQMNPKSFTTQKLFVINAIRKKYQLHLGAIPKEKPIKPIESIKEEISEQTVNVQTNLESPIKKVMPKPIFKKVENVDDQSNALEKPKPVIAKPVFKRPELESKEDETPKTEEPQVPAPISVAKKPMAKPVFKRPEKSDEDKTT